MLIHTEFSFKQSATTTTLSIPHGKNNQATQECHLIVHHWFVRPACKIEVICFAYILFLGRTVLNWTELNMTDVQLWFCDQTFFFLYSMSLFLGGLANLRKATMSFVMSFRPSVLSVRMKNSAPTGTIFMKFYISGFFRNTVEKIQFLLKSEKNTGSFTWRYMYLYHSWAG